MTVEAYLQDFFKKYRLVSVLSDKNGCRVLRVRNQELLKDLVIRVFSTPVLAYNELLSVKCSALPIIYDVINLEDGQIIFEEYIDGITVAEVLECGKYRYLGAKKIISAVCFGLSVLHSRNLVHRDVKPENIVVDKKGRVVLIDFNAARKISNAAKDTVVMGTVGYASPEQILAQSDARTDVYALGILLNVMLTGLHPSQQMAKGKAGRIVRKCTMTTPNDRYQSVKKLFHAL